MFTQVLPKKIKLAGVSFNRGDDKTQHNIDVVTRCNSVPMELVREPGNSHDTNAIRVVAWKMFHLGYIPAHYNKQLSILMDGGEKFEVINHQRHQHSHHKTLGISIELKEI